MKKLPGPGRLPMRTRRNQEFVAFMSHCALFIMLGFAACSSNDEARTAREFIQKYSDAWEREDVEAILKMCVRKKYPDLEIKTDLKKTIEEYWFEVEKEGVERSIQRHDFAYTAWTNTEYVGEQEHGDHIHVDVQVDIARSAIVLVREGQFLKLHPNPSTFH